MLPQKLYNLIIFVAFELNMQPNLIFFIININKGCRKVRYGCVIWLDLFLFFIFYWSYLHLEIGVVLMKLWWNMDTIWIEYGLGFIWL